MSGTSADGIDAVVAEIVGNGRGLRARVIAHTHRPFTGEMRRRIFDACVRGTVAEICELNFILGRHFATAALDVIRKAGLKPKLIAAIGSHGQTIHHLPNASTPSTLQIGEPAVIAELTGITTVASFRARDMAAGGQGAPLVPFADWALFTHPARPRIIQNIGGIANLSFLPQGAKLTNVIAFDTGPGNMVIDGVVASLSGNRLRYDRNGAWASKGKVSSRVLKELLKHPFLQKLPPKTTGREEFGAGFLNRTLKIARNRGLSAEDTLATVTALTASTIASAYERFVLPRIPPRQKSDLEIVIGGGGAKNRTLQQMLAAELDHRLMVTPDQLFSPEDFGIPNAAKEALAFAILAHETLAGRPGNVPPATGAKHPAVLGNITHG